MSAVANIQIECHTPPKAPDLAAKIKLMKLSSINVVTIELSQKVLLAVHNAQKTFLHKILKKN